MEDDFDDCDGDCSMPSVAWSWWALPIALLSLLTGIFRAFQNTSGELLQACCMAANHEMDQRDFRDAAALEIETITEASDG